jgi:hypothetical protein
MAWRLGLARRMGMAWRRLGLLLAGRRLPRCAAYLRRATRLLPASAGLLRASTRLLLSGLLGAASRPEFGEGPWTKAHRVSADVENNWGQLVVKSSYVMLTAGSMIFLSGCDPNWIQWKPWWDNTDSAYSNYQPSYTQPAIQSAVQPVCDSDCQESILKGESWDKSQNAQSVPFNHGSIQNPPADSSNNPEIKSDRQAPSESPKASYQLAKCLFDVVPDVDPDSTGEGAIAVFMTRCKSEYQDYLDDCMTYRTKKECNEMVGATIGLLLHFQERPEKRVKRS